MVQGGSCSLLSLNPNLALPAEQYHLYHLRLPAEQYQDSWECTNFLSGQVCIRAILIEAEAQQGNPNACMLSRVLAVQARGQAERK